MQPTPGVTWGQRRGVAAADGGREADGLRAAGACGAPAPGSPVQSFEHPFQGNLAIRGIGELADLVPVAGPASRSSASQPLGPK